MVKVFHLLMASGRFHVPATLPQHKCRPVPIGYEAERRREKFLAPLRN